jgi:hypothetical protein
MTLFIIYSIFGVFIVPKIVESQLQNNLKTLANWDTQVDHIVFNPYVLSLELKGVQLAENTDQTVISFDRLFINFSLLKSLSGAISFDEISLDQAIINLEIDESGASNFQKAFSSNETEETQTEDEESNEDTGMVALFFELIAINTSKINVSDDSQGENFSLTLSPISLALEDFSTQNNEGGDYDLSISLGKNQELNWKGQIGIAPFQSKGHLALKNIQANSFWHYVKASSPYWLNQANISLSGDYDTSINSDSTTLSIDNSKLLIKDVILSETSESEAFLTFKNLMLAPISFDLTERALNLGHIELNEPTTFIERAPDSSLNILRPLTPEISDKKAQSSAAQVSKETSIEKESESSTFHWKILDINMTDGAVKWRDLALATPAELDLKDIDIKIGTLSDNLSTPFTYDMSFDFQDNNNITQTISGSLSPQPFRIEGDLKLNNFELASLQSYANESANILINSGRLSLDSEYALSLNDQLSGTIKSTSIIDDLNMTDSVLNKPLSGFKQLVLGPVNVSLPSDKKSLAKIEIDTIILDQPFGDVFIAEDGQVNLSHITKSTNKHNEAESLIKEPEQTAASEQDTASIDMLLRLFELKQGQFTFTDSSLNPVFTTQLSDLSGLIEGISSNPDAKSKVDFTGKVDSQGLLDVKGTLNPLSSVPNSDIKIKVNNVNMSMASPYSAKYAGYQIDKGKLDLDLSYLVNNQKLEASNHILLNQFEFGKSVDSPDATSLPLPLAIGILKDRKGKIDLDLPITGNLDDPNFKISSVIINTFVNLITKAVTSPFSILGGLIEGSDDISEVPFAANSSELGAEQSNRILALAEALKQRPNLTLEIRGIADANLDQTNNSVRSAPELITLAKQRAIQLSNFIIKQGQIDANRVFILEPEVIALEAIEAIEAIDPEQKLEQSRPKGPAIISSKFTLGVR